TTRPIPGWNRRPITPAILYAKGSETPSLKPVSLRDVSGRRMVIKLAPEEVFLPEHEWEWSAVDEQVQASATDTADPFTFGHLFTQMIHVHLRLTRRGMLVHSAYSWLDLCDTRRFSSLYQRIVDKLIKPDTERQAQRAGVSNLDYAFHPWFPVLLIGSDKAVLYTRALIEDMVHKKRHLTDPRWLMRVGLYLELLTCLGIFEAVKDEVGDLLTPAERKAFEHSPFFAEIRKRLNPKGWHEVWQLREISFPRFGTPRTGPVSALNLLQKRRATLAFLEVHHDDLKHAIDLAGRNDLNAQETWHRVFRDAERAVLRKTPDAFPELSYLSDPIQNFVLWHQQGQLDVMGLKWVPKQFTALFGDQDGLFPSACNQYRASMNEVAEWAKHRDLMDYTGTECVPRAVSILQAYMGGQQTLLERLQRRDGYSGLIDVEAALPEELQIPTDQIDALLAEVPIFEILSDEERLQIAQTSRTISLGPMERIIIQGREGSSLFLVGDGRLEVLIRQADGEDKLIDIKKRGDVVGEISLLTGAPRTATVRAAEGATVYEIGKRQYEPIIRARPELVDQLATIMERNVQNIALYREAEKAGEGEAANNLSGRIRRFFFGGSGDTWYS
ncbi:MAG: cyclic nucleotide-binding domain-containing protein, partial [Anaerolineales bacterium]|nr:cyclic nucleotide-binding domain-containing protein [Anaerolineales bacterium]